MTGPRETFDRFSGIRPLDANDLVRLAIGFTAGLVFRITGLKRACPALGEMSPGIFVPHRGKPIRVRFGRGVINARPQEVGYYPGVYEPVTLSWFRPTPGQTVIDVGAHVGAYTSIAAERGARVIAVEPDRSNFELLTRNIRDNGFEDRVWTWPVALSDQSGRRRFYFSPGGNTYMSSLDRKWLLRDPRGDVVSTLVDCMTLDELAEACRLKTVDWVKVDVEGHSAQVLKGGAKTLAVAQNLMVEVPVDDAAVRNECLRLIEAAGLRVKSAEALGGERAAISVSNWLCTRE